MSVALKSPPAPQRSRRFRRLQRVAPPIQTSVALPTALPPTSPTVLTPGQQPQWLQGLAALQRVSTPLTLLLVSVTLPIYGWSVYTQRSWGKAYNHLEQLQRQERQLTAANEVRKFQVTQTAESQPGAYVNVGPQTTLFLKPTPLQAKPTKSQSVQSVNASNLPVSY